MVHFTGAPLGTSATARKLELSETRVRQLAESGQLRAFKTSRGQFLFDPEDVARLAAERIKTK
jgi:hypothetical protein